MTRCDHGFVDGLCVVAGCAHREHDATWRVGTGRHKRMAAGTIGEEFAAARRRSKARQEARQIGRRAPDGYESDFDGRY